MGRPSNFNVFVAILSILEITLKFQLDFKGIGFVSSLADIAGNRGLETCLVRQNLLWQEVGHSLTLIAVPSYFATLQKRVVQRGHRTEVFSSQSATLTAPLYYRVRR